MRRIFGKLFNVFVYVAIALVVFVRTFDATNPSLALVLVLTMVSFLIGFIANLGGKLRMVGLLVSLALMVFVITAPFGNYPDTDNFFWLAYGLGYLATPLSTAKWNLVDKRLRNKSEQTTTEH